MRLWTLFLVSTVSLGTLLPLAADAAAGRVLYAFGQVQATDRGGNVRNLRGDDEVDAGDTIETLRGRAQIRFTDGGFVALQPQTQYRIDDYVYAGQTNGSERSFFKLLKGGVRFVTGAIGRVNRANYRITTTTATIGIRGTGGNVLNCISDSTIELCRGQGMKEYLYTNDGHLEICHANARPQDCFATDPRDLIECDNSGCERTRRAGPPTQYVGIEEPFKEDPLFNEGGGGSLPPLAPVALASIFDYEGAYAFADGFEVNPEQGDYATLRSDNVLGSFFSRDHVSEGEGEGDYTFEYLGEGAVAEEFLTVGLSHVARLDAPWQFFYDGEDLPPASDGESSAEMILAWHEGPAWTEDDFNSMSGYFEFDGLSSFTAIEAEVFYGGEASDNLPLVDAYMLLDFETQSIMAASWSFFNEDTGIGVDLYDSNEGWTPLADGYGYLSGYGTGSLGQTYLYGTWAFALVPGLDGDPNVIFTGGANGDDYYDYYESGDAIHIAFGGIAHDGEAVSNPD